ncbi:preprotein translocase subunit SecG [Rhizobacter sp. J219]|jgi:preprotein translocase subunit SecG|uniref:preprotein translocase subunit SecG n=1 Tax=Rhizobacter sp. J219 TaxID=2898430 RepID=UPI002150ECF3|nr:preprotein translocase subunit SecG [Rhizobacter sp. J219]MCR5881666.1 preprotein translocase subunit SecG [Rhizobacter sp. J219]
MQVLMNVVLVVQIVAALTMIGLVLIQHGKGADMGASFGSGASGSLFGATGSANFLSRSTAVCAAIFFCCTLALTYSSSTGRSASAGDSVLDRAGAAPAAASAAASAPAGSVIPGAIPAASAPAPAAVAPAAASIPGSK